MRSQQYKLRKHKDLIFLTQLNEQKINDNIYKYLLVQGKQSTINKITVPLTIHYTLEKYDYQGKQLQKPNPKSINHPKIGKVNLQTDLIYESLMTMKVGQKSWFNLHLSQQNSRETNLQGGFHFCVTLDSMIYKNDNTFVSKCLIYEQNRMKAKQFFLLKNYKQSLKCYKSTINILTGISKKIFNNEQINKLMEFLSITQANYIKCVAKMNGFGGRFEEEIGKTAKDIIDRNIKRYPSISLSYFQKAIYLKYACLFDDAVQAIKDGLKLKFDQNQEQANKQKKTFYNMLEEIKKAKQRNVRHLRRQQIRKIKAMRRTNDVWDSESEEQNQK